MTVAASAVRAETRHAPTHADPHPRFSPTIPLVATRLQPVPPRPRMIRRVRLLEMLAAEPRPAVAAMAAPPGCGKTALLADWIANE